MRDLFAINEFLLPVTTRPTYVFLHSFEIVTLVLLKHLIRSSGARSYLADMVTLTDAVVFRPELRSASVFDMKDYICDIIRSVNEQLGVVVSSLQQVLSKPHTGTNFVPAMHIADYAVARCLSVRPSHAR